MKIAQSFLVETCRLFRLSQETISQCLKINKKFSFLHVCERSKLHIQILKSEFFKSFIPRKSLKIGEIENLIRKRHLAISIVFCSLSNFQTVWICKQNLLAIMPIIMWYENSSLRTEEQHKNTHRRWYVSRVIVIKPENFYILLLFLLYYYA